MEMLRKYAFYREIDNRQKAVEEYQMKRGEADTRMDGLGVCQCRVYLQKLEGKWYLFHFFESEKEFEFRDLPARHVYEFKLHKGDDLSGLKSAGIVIGVAPGKLKEYVRLHDEQPQVIHDLCYQNGFRKSSIFVFKTASGSDYLLQFQEFKGQEDPGLYEDSTYQEWLRVTGKCQKPLPGEQFWKGMEEIYIYKRDKE